MAHNAITHAARRYAMVMLAIVYMFNFIDRQILAILLPAIGAEFKVADSVLGLLAGTTFTIFYATLGIPIARLADRFSRRNLITIALAVWSGMTALCGVAANIVQLAFARVGVGIGEAGCSPPAHSMIADYYPPANRATAMGFYTLGISAGIMLANIAGGWISQNIGWREAFFIVGAPGLLLAILFRMTVSEPPRGMSEERSDSGRQPPLREVLRFLMGRRSFLHLSVAAGLTSLTGYSVITWFPSFMVRSFDMDIASVGLRLGLILGFVGGFGFFFGGYLSDYFGRKSQKFAMQFIAASVLLTALFYVAVFLAPTPSWCLAFYLVPAAISNFYLAPVLAQVQSLVSLRMRATASALMLFVINIIGFGVGPPLTGWLSDVLASTFAHESMRFSLLAVCTTMLVWAAWHYHAGAKFVEMDLARARDAD